MKNKELVDYCKSILEGKEEEQETLSEQEISSLVHEAKVRCLLEYKSDATRDKYDSKANTEIDREEYAKKQGTTKEDPFGTNAFHSRIRTRDRLAKTAKEKKVRTAIKKGKAKIGSVNRRRTKSSYDRAANRPKPGEK